MRLFGNQPSTTFFALHGPFSSALLAAKPGEEAYSDFFSIPLELESTADNVTQKDNRQLGKRRKKQQRKMKTSEGMMSNQITGLPHHSHRYELIDNRKKFELTIDVPGVKEEDIEINIDDDGRQLSVKGKRIFASTSESSHGSTGYSFAESFSLGSKVNVDNLTAKLNNGVLVVSAPKDDKKHVVRRIPIITSPKDSSAKIDNNKMEEETTANVKDNAQEEEKECTKKDKTQVSPGNNNMENDDSRRNKEHFYSAKNK